MFVKIAKDDRIDVSELKRYYIYPYLNSGSWMLNLYWKKADNYSQITYDSKEEAEEALRKIDEAVGIGSKTSMSITEDWA